MVGLFVVVGILLVLAPLFWLAMRADDRDRIRRDNAVRDRHRPDVLSARDREALPPDLTAEPWAQYPLAPEDWALLEAAQWKPAEARAAFERAQQAADVHITWWAVDTGGEMGTWAWKCSAGDGSGHGFPDEQTVMLSAQAHLERDHRHRLGLG